MNLEELGITKDELADRLVEALARDLNMDTTLGEMVRDRLHAKIQEVAEEHVLPRVDELIEGIVLQKTNAWGESQGEKKSFREYLVDRAEAYLREEVNFEGKSKAEHRGGYWNKGQTRITHLVDQHLQYAIESALKDALKMVNEALTHGIAETVKMKMGEIAKSIKVKVGR
jgi:hypothetical protein